ARLTCGDNTSDLVWSLAERLVCSTQHAENFHTGDTFITTQVDYIASVLAGRLVAWSKETEDHGEALEKKTVAPAGCPDVHITPAKSAISGTQCPKVLPEGPHTNENATGLDFGPSEGTT